MLARDASQLSACRPSSGDRAERIGACIQALPARVRKPPVLHHYAAIDHDPRYVGAAAPRTRFVTIISAMNGCLAACAADGIDPIVSNRPGRGTAPHLTVERPALRA